MKSWEKPEIKERDPNDWWYSIENRRARALEERKFRIEDLDESDMRYGDTRRLMTQKRRYTRDEIRIRNSFEGLV